MAGTGVNVWHFDHDGHWNKNQYIRSGREFLRLLSAVPPDMRRDAWVSDHVATTRIGRGHYGSTVLRRVEARILAVLLSSSRTHMRHVLREISDIKARY